MDRGGCKPRGGGRGRGRPSPSPSPSAQTHAYPHHPAVGANSHFETPFNIEDNMDPPYRNRSSQPRSASRSLKPYNHANTPGFMYGQVRHSPGAKDLSSGVEKLHLADEALTPISRASASSSEKGFPHSSSTDRSVKIWMPRKGRVVDDSAKSGGSSFFEPSPAVENTNSVSGSSLKGIPNNDKLRCELTPQKKVEASGKSEDSGHQMEESGKSEDSGHLTMGATFDICPPSSGAVIKLKPSLHVQNRMRRDEAKRCMEGQTIIELRSGMILLKKYLSFSDQVKIVRECRELGLGPGGFYEPGFRDGGKLHLKMMCLGKNWDPEKSEYGDVRPSDGAKPPLVPSNFHQLVKGTIKASHSFLREHSKVVDVGCMLPSMSPNICIVNFYTKSGRLGLHQDKDESAGSINCGLPVVSFSIGDSAEFLYGDQRDPDKAEKVVLESGDVLIFGGKSRLVFHGVKSILSDTAPKALLEETCLCPGRLNLTFRES